MARKRTTSKYRDYVDIYGNYHTGYTHKTKSGKHQLNLAYELQEVLNEYANELISKKEIALDKAADFLLEKLEQNSPYDETSSGKHFKDSWLRTDKYQGVRYIGNSKIGSKNKEYGGDIPLSNLIEFGSKGKPFIRRTFEENKDKLIEIIKGEIENGNSK